MIAEAQQTPRPWDGRRLLRFLTGLAMLALAVTLRLPGPAVAVVVPAEALGRTAVTVVAEAPAEEIRTEPEAGVSIAGPAETIDIVPAPRTLPGGEIPQSAGSRAPPAR